MATGMVVQQVKITRGRGWYRGLVGETFEVYRDRRDFILKEDYDRGHEYSWGHIDFDDCEVVDESA